MNDALQRDETGNSENPYSSDPASQEQSLSHQRRSVAAIVTSVFVGVLSGVLACVVCWIAIRVVFGAATAPAQMDTVPMDLLLPALVGVATAGIIGSRVQRRIGDHFERIHQAELRRAAMTEHMADLRHQLRQRSDPPSVD